MDTLQINSIKRMLSQLYIRLGVAQIRQVDTDISTKNDSSTLLMLGLQNFGIPPVLLDNIYYYTSFENWQTIMQTLNPIVQQFTWEAERFDCDKRANLLASLVSLLFRLNTCGTIYCEVQNVNGGEKYLHYINFIVDDKGIGYIWDADNGGLYQKITGQDMVMGNVKYHFKSARTI